MSTNSTVGVIFDMDGVLIDSAKPHFESWKELGRQEGVEFTEKLFKETFGLRNSAIVPKAFGPVSQKRLHELADRKETLYREIVRDNAPIVPGAVELIRTLHRHGARLAVGSSAPPENIELVLRIMGITECFTATVSAKDVTRGKPDPQVFRLAAERIGVRPERCVVVEDAPAGIQAAKRAGAKTVAVLIHHQLDAFPGPDMVVQKLVDLTAERISNLVEQSVNLE